MIPEAAFHDVPGATLPWLRSQLADNPLQGGRNLLLFAHHPLSKLPLDLVEMSFSVRGYERLAGSLRDHKGAVALWDAGHVHRNAEYEVKTLGLRDTGCKGIETGATKDGNLRLITVWGASPDGR